MSNEFKEELIEEVKAKKPTKKKVEPKTEEEERVEVFIPQVDGEENELVVGVNGKMYKMKAGMSHSVPKSVAHVLQLSYHQDRIAILNRENFKNQEL